MASFPKQEPIGVMGHCIANYPSPEDARQIIGAMADAGVHVIEIQIPFSEPMADGPTFMLANHKAVDLGVTFSDSLALMREMSATYPEVRFLFMSYVNMIFNQGFKEFVEGAKQAGAKGAIIPDLPPEHAAEYLEACKSNDFANVVVIPPNVDDDRLKVLCDSASGLVYAVARAGVTGTKSDLGAELRKFVGRIRQCTETAIAVGFGIQTKADVNALNGVADYAVIGSQGLRAYEANGISGVKSFWQNVTG